MNPVLLGLLTFVVTPIVSMVVMVPILLLGHLSENLNPIAIVVKIFALRDFGGFVVAQVIVVGSLAVIGDLATAGISWRIHRSKKLAGVTFLSALLFQVIAATVVVPAMVGQFQKIAQLSTDVERSYQQMAKIGEVGFEVKEPYSDLEIGNHRPEYGPKHKKLEIVIPISVFRAGFYGVTVDYGYSKEGERGVVPTKSVTQSLAVGDHLMRVEFLAHEVSSYGFWAPSSVGGTAEVQLSYLASGRELPDRRASHARSTIHKFVDRKSVRF